MGRNSLNWSDDNDILLLALEILGPERKNKMLN